MSNFIADARIVVRADTSAFSAEITRITKETERRKILVKIVPDPTGFTNAVRQVIRDTQPSLPPIRIRMVADPTGFRASVLAAARAATEGLSIPVGVTAGRATGAAAGGAVATGGVVDKRLSSAQLAIATATDAGVAARRRFDKALSESEKQMLRDQRISAQLKTATDAVKAATIAGNPALLAQAEALQLVALREHELNVARKERAAAPGLQAAADAEAAAAAAAAEAKAAENAAARQLAAENKVATARANLTTQFTRESGERIAATQAEIQAVLDQQRVEAQARKEQLATSRQARFRQRQVATAAPFAEEAFARNQAIADSADAAARAETQFAAARRASARATVLAGDPERALAATRAAERATIDAVVESQIAYNAAIESGIPAIIATREQELALAKARLTDSAAATASAEKLAARAGQIGAGRRALEAFGASLAGLRGAALSAQGAFIATGAAAIALTKAVQSAAQFESTINVFRVTAGATADEMERVRATATALGRDITLPGVGAQDAAEALTELSKAGLSVQDSIDGARGVLQLATAANIDNAQATELAASALNAFGLAGNQAVRVADTLANAANASQGSIVDVGVALQQSAAVARQAGLTLEQTVGVLTLFARAGLKGSDAGTSFRTALIRLINPTAKAQKEIDKLGLHLRTASGAINLGVFDEFTQKTQDLTKAQRDQALAVIFGQDAIRGAAILSREGAAALDTQIEGLRRQGTAAELANARMTGFTGSLENLKNQLSALGIAIGEAVIPPLKIMTDAIAFEIGIINEFADSLLTLADAAKTAVEALKDLPGDVVPEVKIGPVDSDKQGKEAAEGFVKGAKLVLKNTARGLILGPFAIVANAKDIADQFRGSETSSEKVAKQVRIILSGLKGASDTMADINFSRVVGELEALQQRLAKGDKNAQRLSGDVADIITKLKEGNALPPFRFPKVKLPPELQTGLPGKQAGTAITDAFDAALPGEKIFNIAFNAFKNVEGGIRAGLSGLTLSINQALDIAQQALENKLNEIGKQAQTKLANLQSSALQLQVEGATPQQLLANARRQEAEARAALTAGIAGHLSKAELDKRRKAVIAAHEEVKGFLSDIKNDAEKQKSEAEAAKTKAQQAQNDADQAVLDALAPATRRLDTRALIAEGTPQLQDNIKVAQAQQRNNRHQIAVIRKSFNDQENAGKLIADLKDDNVRLGQQIRADLQSMFQAAQQAFQAKIDAATAAGAIDKVIAATKARIAKLERLIEASKGEGEKLKAYRTELTQRRQELESLTDERLQARTDFAQSVLDLTGNKNPLLRAINAQIKEAQQDARQAKRGSVAWLRAMTEVNTLKKRKKDVLDEAKDVTKDRTTAFDLLTEFNAKFNDIAGNVVNQNQPFAGSSAFSTDIVNKAIAGFQQGGLPHRPIDIRLRGDDQQSKQISVTEKLIAVIQENTDVIRGGRGNRSTQSVFVPGEIEGKNKLAAFWAARTAREVKDG